MKNYWDQYYSKNSTPFSESNFAEFSLKYLQENVIDIGCGNGRDSVYFSKNGLRTLGIDGSKIAIENLKKFENDNLSFDSIDLADIHKAPIGKFKNAYCRFLFHAINEDVENLLLNWIKNNIEENLLIETRVMTKKDLEQSKHYRRIVKPDLFLNKIKKFEMGILYNETSQKFSPYEYKYNVNDLKEDPSINRLVIKVN
tara:strand:- start:828 stop:1424 length:597 start_codon:yes stop_codon:yes gene_type:complete